MPAAVPSWNLVRLYGTWRTQNGALMPGTYEVTVPVRITNSTDDAIIPKGSYAKGSLQTDVNGAPSLDLLVPATDDPDNEQTDWRLQVKVTFSGAGAEEYVIDVPIANRPVEDGGNGLGVNLRTIALGGTVPQGNPLYAVGVAGGLAKLDTDGDVIDADGTKILGGGGGTGGAVSSVNGETGAVVLDAADVGARPAGDVPWAEVSGAPATFPPSAHQHPVGDVTGLQGALDGKAPSSHTHSIANVTGLQAAIDGKAATTHTHAVGDVSGLQAALDAKAATAHQHNASDINAGTLDAARIPDLAQSKITGLAAALTGKVAGGNGINSIVKLTQTQYDALGTKDAATLYVIDGA